MELMEALELFIEGKLGSIRENTDDRHTNDEGENDIHNGTAEGSYGVTLDSLDFLERLDTETVKESDCMDAGIVNALGMIKCFLHGYKEGMA